MRKDWLELATRPVPRYTSYPTAVQFQDDLSKNTVENWVNSHHPDNPISVYVHVPFCEKLCWYCGCHTTIPNGYERVNSYVKTLLKEIQNWQKALPAYAGCTHLHFGGGTPNILSADDSMMLFDALRMAFDLRDDAEISVELDPRTLDPEKIKAFAASGVTRASLGVQDFNQTVQEAINRVQPYEQVNNAVSSLREADIDAINFDLLYGLPHQTTDSVERTAEMAAELEPNRISAFGYAHVPWFAKHQRAIDEKYLPGPEARFEQYHILSERLQSLGYVAIGLDHFAREDDPLAEALKTGNLHRNFQGYTTDTCRTLVGLGPSAISEFPSGYVQNWKDIRAYGDAVHADTLASARGTVRTREDKLRGAIIERIMCDMKIDIAHICARFDADVSQFGAARGFLRDLVDIGICETEGSVIRVKPEARILLRSVAQCFDAYSPPDHEMVKRHAQAI